MSSYTILTMHAKEPKFAPHDHFVRSKFIRGVRYGNDWFKAIHNDSYFAVYSKFIETLLFRPESKVRLAVLTDEPDTALGWSLIEEKKLHFIYVKPDVRKHGIGRSLLTSDITHFTHLTKDGKIIWKEKFKELYFDPFT